MSQGLGRALMSIGEDVMQYGAQTRQIDAQERIARMREENDLAVQRLRAELFGTGGGARSPGGAGRGGASAPMNDSAQAAVGGFDSVPEYQAARKRYEQGPEMAMQPDMSGKGMTGGLDEADYGRSNQETVASEAAGRNAGKVRTSLMRSSTAPGTWDDAERAESERTRREQAFAPGADVQDVNRRAGAMKGEGEFAGDTNVTRNKFTGQTQDTPMSESTRKSQEALARQRDARADRDDRAPAGGSRGTNSHAYRAAEQLFKDAERDAEQAQKSLERAEEQRGKALTRSQREDAAQVVARREQEVKDARSRAAQAQQRMQAIADGQTQQGQPAAAADKFVTGKVYRDANGNRATYLGNGKWEPVR